LNSRATGPKSTRGLGHQRPSRPGSHGTRLARRGPTAYSRGPQASEAGPGAAPARRLEHARLTRHLAMRAQRSTVARPVASAQWPDDEKVFPHDIVAIPHTGPTRKYRWQGIGAGRRRGGRSHRCAVAVPGGFGGRGNRPRFGKLFPRWVGAPGPAQEDERRVRQLGTDRAAGTEVRHDRGGLPEEGSGGGADKMKGMCLLL
jgi:hypothetical protein